MFNFLLTSSLGRICHNHELTVAMCMICSNDKNCLIYFFFKYFRNLLDTANFVRFYTLNILQ